MTIDREAFPGQEDFKKPSCSEIFVDGRNSGSSRRLSRCLNSASFFSDLCPASNPEGENPFFVMGRVVMQQSYVCALIAMMVHFTSVQMCIQYDAWSGVLKGWAPLRPEPERVWDRHSHSCCSLLCLGLVYVWSQVYKCTLLIQNWIGLDQTIDNCR